MAKNKGLGRGLDALLDELDAPQPEQRPDHLGDTDPHAEQT